MCKKSTTFANEMAMQVLNISIGEIIDLLIMLLGVAIICIAAFSYRKQNFIRLQVAHQKIDELSQRMAEQEAALLKQQHLYDLDKRLVTIRTQHPAPEKTWTNYNSMLQDIDAQLNNWIASFESRTQLAEREVQFCTYLLIYPHLTFDYRPNGCLHHHPQKQNAHCGKHQRQQRFQRHCRSTRKKLIGTTQKRYLVAQGLPSLLPLPLLAERYRHHDDLYSCLSPHRLLALLPQRSCDWKQ